MEKVNVSPDFLYDYLTEHDFKVSVLAKRMGVSLSIVTGCFHHDLNRHGKPLSFSAANIKKLNDAMSQVASELRQCIITFGSSETYTNRWGNTYDPATVEPMQRLGEYFNSKALTERVLGWNKVKRDTTLAIKKSSSYGNITKEDVNRINTELLAVAGVLSSYMVVADDSEASSN